MAEPQSIPFPEIWNSCTNVTEVCARTGKIRRAATNLASYYRSRGVVLKILKESHAKSALPGGRFGRWTVVEVLPRSKRLCRCDCGTLKVIGVSTITGDKPQSTGCIRCRRRRLRPDAAFRKPEWKTWQGMKGRCKYPVVNGYERYGGRGIRVCALWEKSFAAFYEDLGPKPSPEYTIDRINVNGNYSCGHCDECRANGWPANCRWATPEEQQANVRPKAIKPPEPCSNCGWPQKPLRRGLCHACNEYLRRRGRLPTEANIRRRGTCHLNECNRLARRGAET